MAPAGVPCRLSSPKAHTGVQECLKASGVIGYGLILFLRCIGSWRVASEHDWLQGRQTGRCRVLSKADRGDLSSTLLKGPREPAMAELFLHTPPFRFNESMILPFAAVCELWEQLSCARKTKYAEAAVLEWFERHGPSIPRQRPGGLAVLSCLFPHKRPDRVYGLREKKLTGITVKAWGLRHRPSQRAATTPG